MKPMTRIIYVLLLVASASACSKGKPDSLKAPWDKWYFAFTTPKALPAEVTLLKLLDVDGYAWIYRTIDQPRGISVGKWDEENSAGSKRFNNADRLPQIMIFCWDSIIDKKVYHSTLFFTKDTWNKMTTPYPDVFNPEKKAYRQTMLIGLAPEGKVRVWLRQYGHTDIPLNDTTIRTVSGKELDMCKDETNFSNGYEYSEDMKEFIKNKNTLTGYGKLSGCKHTSALTICQSSKPWLGQGCLEYTGRKIMKPMTRMIYVLLLVASASACSKGKPDSLKAPWDKWYFAFTTPKALPAEVTLLKLLDVDGYAWTYRTINQPQGISVGKWDEENSAGNTHFNNADRLPQIMIFCWDSIIDKKVYQSTLFFTKDTWNKMTTPYPDVSNPAKKAYRQTMLIGLAPEGKVRVWLRQYGHSDIPLNDTTIRTVSGEELDMCKGVTVSNFSYGYSDKTKEFIEGKEYPYGSW